MCSVTIRNQRRRPHAIETDAPSVFDAANEGIKSFCKDHWFDLKLPIEVVSGKERWLVDQEKVR
jgi:hypothetical protein